VAARLLDSRPPREQPHPRPSSTSPAPCGRSR
jgi:hypothetical protein